VSGSTNKAGHEHVRRVATTIRGERRRRETQVRIIHPHARRRRDPSIRLKASSGIPAAMRSGVVPSRLLPHLMWASRKLSGRPGSSASVQRVTAEFNGHRVDLDAVEAAADDVAQGSPGGLRATARRRLFARMRTASRTGERRRPIAVGPASRSQRVSDKMRLVW
jgi:hypothetical protein